jgi:hypothetical protein
VKRDLTYEEWREAFDHMHAADAHLLAARKILANALPTQGQSRLLRLRERLVSFRYTEMENAAWSQIPDQGVLDLSTASGYRERQGRTSAHLQ